MEVSGCGADSADEAPAAAPALPADEDVPSAQRKRRSSDGRSPPVSKDIRACLVQGGTTTIPSWEEGEGIVGMRDPSGGEVATGVEAVLGAFKLAASEMQQDVGVELMGQPSGGGDGLVISALQKPCPITNIRQAVTLLVASTPLQPSGEAIFSQLPPMWLKFSGRNDALGLRCLFTSRRHEHSVFTPLPTESFLQVPEPVKDWQPAIIVPANTVDPTGFADEDPWVADVHAGNRCLRIMLRPGVLLLRMLQRGTALPAAHFTWRVVDTSDEAAKAGRLAERPPAHRLGEFSILSNLEDAAHPQPPRFHDWPLRREQLRSLGWMVSQERRRREPFSVELKDGVPFVDAQHWRLEGCLRCEYGGVKGGVLADAIGYGKTACTIGLIDCTKADPLPCVPRPFAGFIPSRATLILAPTNLHSQWICEIVKFTRQTLKVVSVPTCTQLKCLTAAELASADVVVATYRLFYSTPYLRRLEELAKTKQPDFRMPTSSKGHNGKTQSMPEEWARAYRTAFQLLPSCTGAMEMIPNGGAAAAAAAAAAPEEQEQGRKKRPGRPMKSARQSAPEPPPAEATGELEVSTQLYCGEAPPADGLAAAAAALDGGTSQADPAGKRRRLVGKQATSCTQEATQAVEAPPTPQPLGLGQGTAPDLQFVPLEAFWWRRVVCDEFHELLNRYPPAQVAIKLFHADYKWGLSGTPPCETLAQIRKAAGFLGVQLPLNEGGGAKTDSSAEAPRRVAQEWLDAFVRRNTSELPPLDEEEQIVLVKQSPKERALYMALTGEQDTMSAAAAAAPEIEKEGAAPEIRGVRCNSAGLLKLCSHFAPGGANVLTAEDECERQLALRKGQVRSIERQARSLAERAAMTAELVRAFEPHFCRVPLEEDFPYIRKEPKQALAARLAVLGSSTSGTKPALLARLFSEVANAGEEKKALALSMDLKADGSNPTGDGATGQGVPDMAKWLDLRKKAFVDPSALESASKAQKLLLRNARAAISAVEKGAGAVPPPRCVSLRAKLGMPRWPNSTEREAASASSRAWKTFQEEDLVWRRNPENAANLHKVIKAWKEDMEFCAERITALEEELEVKLNNLTSFQQHTAQSPQDATVTTAQGPTGKFAKYGSKIQAIVKHVQKLKAQEPGCKIICFVQWEDLKRKIASALEEFALGHLTLHGSVWARRAALTKFQYEAGGPQMLLLSLEESASGTNLTAANHVIIVHPMQANTREEAVAFEMQAVGRVRRPGQQRKIHVWRFVTVGTIEQQITEEHQQELWERQRDKVPMPEGPQDIPTESEPEDADLMDADGDEAAAPLPPAPVLEDELLATQPYLPGVADVATPFRALQRSGGGASSAAASSSGIVGAGAGSSSSKEAAEAGATRGRSRSRGSKPGNAMPGQDPAPAAAGGPSKSPGSGGAGRRRAAAAPPEGKTEAAPPGPPIAAASSSSAALNGGPGPQAGADAVMQGQDFETLPYGDLVGGYNPQPVGAAAANFGGNSSTSGADLVHLIPETQDYGIQEAEGFAAGVAAVQQKEVQQDQGDQDDMDPPWGKVSEEEEAAMPWARISAGKAQDAAAAPATVVKGIESLPETLQWDDVEADTVPATAAYPEDRVWMNPPGYAKHIIQDDSAGCLAATQYYEDLDATQRYQ